LASASCFQANSFGGLRKTQGSIIGVGNYEKSAQSL